jgi:hypothetical protein
MQGPQPDSRNGVALFGAVHKCRFPLRTAERHDGAARQFDFRMPPCARLECAIPHRRLFRPEYKVGGNGSPHVASLGKRAHGRLHVAGLVVTVLCCDWRVDFALARQLKSEAESPSGSCYTAGTEPPFSAPSSSRKTASTSSLPSGIEACPFIQPSTTSGDAIVTRETSRSPAESTALRSSCCFVASRMGAAPFQEADSLQVSGRTPRMVPRSNCGGCSVSNIACWIRRR